MDGVVGGSVARFGEWFGAGLGARVRRRWRRTALIAVALVVVLVVGAVLHIGWGFSSDVITVHDADGPEPTVPVTAVAPDGTWVRLGRDPRSEWVGSYGLRWAGGFGQLGPVISSDATTVTRGYRPVRGTPTPGTAASVQWNYYDYDTGDPRSALGLDYQDVTVRSDVGDLPTWYVPAARTTGTWVVFVHGREGHRRDALRILPLLHGRGLPVLVPTYRNDPGAPPSPDHRHHLGDTEWRDVEAAVRWATAHGAGGVVLLGASMGGAMSLQLVQRSPLRDVVRGLVLDSPVLDWWAALDRGGRRSGLPSPVNRVAYTIVGLRLGVDLGRFDQVARAAELTVPVLLLHSAADSVLPNGPSLALQRARPDLVTYVDIPGADHTNGWNADRARYESALAGWLSDRGA